MNAGHHSTHHSRPSIKGTTQTEGGHRYQTKGTPASDGRGQHHSTRPSSAMPPTTAMPPTHPRWPHPPPLRGGNTQRIPHHAKEYRHTHHHTPHTRQRTAHDTAAILMSTAVGWTRHAAHHCTRQDSSTHHRHSMEYTRRTDTIRTVRLFSHCVHTLNDQRRSTNNNQRSMIDQRTMNNEHDDQ